MPQEKSSTYPKILVSGPKSELKSNVLTKLHSAGYESCDFQTISNTTSFSPSHLLFIYHLDGENKHQNSVKTLLDEFLDLAQLLQVPISVVVNIDPFLDLKISNHKVIYPKNFRYVTENTYDSVYPIEKTSSLIKQKKIKASIIRVGFLYSQNYQNYKSIVDYLLLQAITTGKITLPVNHKEHIYPTSIDDAGYGIVRSLIGFKNKRNVLLLNHTPISLDSIAKQIREIFYKQFRRKVQIFVNNNLFSPTIKLSQINIEKSTQKINWNTKTSIAQLINSIELPGKQKKPNKKSAKFVNQKSHKKYYISITIGFIFILISPIIFIIFNSLSAIYDLQIAKDKVIKSEFDEALQRIKFSESKFNRNLVVYSIINFFPGISDRISLIKDINHFSLSGIYLSRAFTSGIDIARNTTTLAQTIQEGNNNNALDNLVSDTSVKINVISNNLQLSYLESQKLSSLVAGDQIQRYQGQIKQLYEISQRASIMTPLIPEIIGTNGNRKYLILNLNNNELRPGGGFIGSYSTIDFNNGKFVALKVGDIYDIDGQLKQKIPAPAPLVDHLGVDGWYLRDANWDPDFKNNYPVIKEFYFKETGENIDGVIAVDLEFIKSILSFTGPISLDDYSETVTAENIVELGQKYSEVNFFPGSRQKKNFFSSLSRKLIDQLLVNQKYLTPKFLSIIDQSLLTQSLQVAFSSQKVEYALESLDLANTIPGKHYSPASQDTQDYLMIADANLGANKSNAYIEKKLNYQINLDKNGNILSDLKINYRNNSPNNSWPAGEYKNYLRTFVPRGSKLEKVIFDNQDITTQFQSFDDGVLTFFAGNILIPAGSEKSLNILYTQPKGIDVSQKTSTYSFYYQKQAGTYNVDLNFEFNFPDFFKISSQNGDILFSEQKVKFIKNTNTSEKIELTLNR